MSRSGPTARWVSKAVDCYNKSSGCAKVYYLISLERAPISKILDEGVRRWPENLSRPLFQSTQKRR